MMDQAIEAVISGSPLEARSQQTIPKTNPKMVVTKTLKPLISPPLLMRLSV
jgi:hypothetical protein